MKKNRMLLKIWIFIILTIISFTIEHTILRSPKECNKKNKILAYIVSMVHNIGNIYITYGSLLFGHYIFHFIVLLIVLILWYVSYKVDKTLVGCIITQIYNNLCGFDKKRNFREMHYYIFNNILGIKNYSVGLLTTIGLYDLYHIYFMFF